MSRVRTVIDEMHKEANIFSGAGKLLANNPAAGVGAAAGGLYGAYKGSKGEEGGLKGALVGGAQGAAGGAIVGGVGHKLYKSVRGVDGKPGVFGQYGQARKKLMDEAGVAKENQGFFSRHFGEGRKKLKEFKTGQETNVTGVKERIRDITDKADASLMDPAAARKAIDTEMSSNAVTNLAGARDKLVVGGIGAGMALGTGAGLVRQGAKSGEGMSDEQRMQTLRARYQETGKLDPREMNMLTGMLKKPKSNSAL
jgi:hypothetical protein